MKASLDTIYRVNLPSEFIEIADDCDVPLLTSIRLVDASSLKELANIQVSDEDLPVLIEALQKRWREVESVCARAKLGIK